jgi:hypothetical protein
LPSEAGPHAIAAPEPKSDKESAMLLQEATPDTSAYMIAGYAVFCIVMIVYLASLMIRRRNLEQDLTTLQAMETESKVRVGDATGARRTRTTGPAARPKSAKRSSRPKKTSSKK